jgi:hypothetical protein
VCEPQIVPELNTLSNRFEAIRKMPLKRLHDNGFTLTEWISEYDVMLCYVMLKLAARRFYFVQFPTAAVTASLSASVISAMFTNECPQKPNNI